MENLELINKINSYSKFLIHGTESIADKNEIVELEHVLKGDIVRVVELLLQWLNANLLSLERHWAATDIMKITEIFDANSDTIHVEEIIKILITLTSLSQRGICGAETELRLKKINDKFTHLLPDFKKLLIEPESGSLQYDRRLMWVTDKIEILTNYGVAVRRHKN